MILEVVSDLPLVNIPHVTWHRSINSKHIRTAFDVAHTARDSSRFSHVTEPPSYEILYLGQDPVVGLFEVEALYGMPWEPGGSIANPVGSWTHFPVIVHLAGVVDLTDIDVQTALGTSPQELTGDWQGYHLRGPHTPISLPTAPSPTQKLGRALFDARNEGLLTVSARIPYCRNLVVFPQRLKPSSYLEFADPLTGRVERITTRSI